MDKEQAAEAHGHRMTKGRFTETNDTAIKEDARRDFIAGADWQLQQSPSDAAPLLEALKKIENICEHEDYGNTHENCPVCIAHFALDGYKLSGAAPQAAGPVWVKVEDGFPDLNVRRLQSKESITVLVSQGSLMCWAKYISQDTGGKGWIGCHWTPTHWAYIPLPNESGAQVFTWEQMKEISQTYSTYVNMGGCDSFSEWFNTNYPQK